MTAYSGLVKCLVANYFVVLQIKRQFQGVNNSVDIADMVTFE